MSISKLGPDRGKRWDPAGFARTCFSRLRAGILVLALRIAVNPMGRLRGAVIGGNMLLAAVLVAAGSHHIYLERRGLPDLDPFSPLLFPTIGHIYDTNGKPLSQTA